jgi:hypothetical protein
MHNQVMKWTSIVALLLAVVFWKAAPDYQRELNLIVAMAAAFVFVQAYRAGKHLWAVGFAGIALLFNPVVPMFRLGGDPGLGLVVFSIVPFAMSLIVLKSQPRLSIASITDRNPGSQSL